MLVHNKYLTQWLVVGDRSRYILLKWLLGDNNLPVYQELANHKLKLEYGPRVGFVQKEKEWLITTPALLPLSVIYFPVEDDVIEDGITNIIYIEEPPFYKASTNEKLLALRGHYPESHFCVVIMDLPRHLAYSDLLQSGEDIALALTKYKEQGYNVKVLVNSDDINNVLDWYEPSDKYWQNVFISDLERLAQRIDDLDIEFQFILEDLEFDKGILSPEVKESFTDYSLVKKACVEQKPVWKNFVEAGGNHLFPVNRDMGIYVFLPIYKGAFEDNKLCFWNIEKDEEQLILELKRAYNKQFSKSHFAFIPQYEMLTESQYVCALENQYSPLYKIREEYNRLYDDFLNKKVLEIIQKHMLNKYQRMRGLLE